MNRIWAGAVMAMAGTAGAQTGRLHLIPDLPHSAVLNSDTIVRAVADNGMVAAAGADLNSQWYGTIFNDTSYQAMRFDPSTGESVALGKFTSAFNSSTCGAISRDGSQVFGVSTTNRSSAGQYNSRVFRWTSGAGLEQLPIIPGDPDPTTFAGVVACTPDGSLLMGGCGTNTTYRWAAWPLGAGQPPYQFPDPVHTIFGEIKAVSDDAHIVFGFGNQTSRALIWTLGAPALTSVALPNATNSTAVAVSEDGLTFIGTSDTIYNGQHVAHAFRYRADTGVVDISLPLSPSTYHQAMAASGDGNTVLGIYAATLPPDVPAWQGYSVAWIWRQGTGIVPLETYFTQELGLSLRGLVHPVPFAMSRNGRWIACQAADPTEQEKFISFLVDTRPPLCGSADFNCDGDTGTDQDIEAFFACLAGSCPSAPCASTADFDGDGDAGTDADIEAFFRVLAGGAC